MSDLQRLPKVLVVGAGGFFGRLLVDDLDRYGNCRLVLGRRRAFRSERFQTVVADLQDPQSLQRALNGVTVAICAAGPFQELPLTLAELCMDQGIHYIDLADSRRFVLAVQSRVGSIKRSAAICTGWSTVSALTGALTQIGTTGMRSVDSIAIHMAPGKRGGRNLATIASLLHSVGNRFTVHRNGRKVQVRGWSEPRDFLFPGPVGLRRGYLVDVPDHEIFPELFSARTVEFRAGSELHLLNNSLSLLARIRHDWTNWTWILQSAAAMFGRLGHDCGAVGVEVLGGSQRRRVSIVADSRAERIAVMPASIMATALLSGANHSGLVSHAHWLSRGELDDECIKRGFRLIVEEF